MRPIDADKLEKQIKDYKVEECFCFPTPQRKAVFEWTKGDICEMVKNAPTIGGMENEVKRDNSIL